jgi:hypothetical protein
VFEETEAMRQKMLTLVGRSICFGTEEILAIPGQDFAVQYTGFDTPIEPGIQTVSFLVTAKDVRAAQLDIDDLFYYLHAESKMRFNCSIRNFIPDLEGWFTLQCNLLSYEYVP